MIWDDDCLIRISPTVIMPVITGSLLTVWRSLVSSERWMMRSHLYSLYLQYYLETERAVAVARLHPSNKTLSILSWELTLSGNQLVLTFCDKLADRQTVLMRLNVPCCLRFLCCSNLRFVFQRVAWLNWLNSGGWVGHMGTQTPATIRILRVEPLSRPCQFKLQKKWKI